MFIGGVGSDGHIAFNEPTSSLNSKTIIKILAYRTLIDNSRFFDYDINKVPKQALTVGIRIILEANEVLIMVEGVNKAKALAFAIEEGISHMCRLSALQLHPKGMIIANENACSELKVNTYKYFKSLSNVTLK